MKILRLLLFPFSLIYGIIVWLRNKLFDWGVFKSQPYSTPIIAIGNLSTGGTGKTPHTEYLIRLFKDDYKTAVLSRGYGRKTNGYIKANTNHTANDIGDEPKQYFDKFKNSIVAVSEKRVLGIEKLLKTDSPEVILLDDAYQHRWVKAGYNILLTDYNKPFYKDWILPTGNLREGISGKKRANCILVTKCPIGITEADRKRIVSKVNPCSNQEVFFSTFSYRKAEEVFTDKVSIIDTVKNALVVTGIASPTPLYEYLSSNDITVKKLRFPDHHSFTKTDIETIKKEFELLPEENKIIITTEKDATRLKEFVSILKELPIYQVPIEVKFLFDDEDKFNALLKNFVST